MRVLGCLALERSLHAQRPHFQWERAVDRQRGLQKSVWAAPTGRRDQSKNTSTIDRRPVARQPHYTARRSLERKRRQFVLHKYLFYPRVSPFLVHGNHTPFVRPNPQHCVHRKTGLRIICTSPVEFAKKYAFSAPYQGRSLLSHAPRAPVYLMKPA